MSKPAELTKAVAPTQAGGGTAVAAALTARRVDEFKPVVAAHIKHIYESLSKTYSLKSAAEVQSFWQKEQGETLKLPADGYQDGELSLQGFASIMKCSNALGDLATEDKDYSKSLSNYFISSSHNTYLTGHQLYGEATTDGYKNVLLRGCRCVEIDVWDGETSSSEESSSSEEGAESSKDKWRKRLGIGARKLGRQVSKRTKSKEMIMPATPVQETDGAAEAALEKPKPWRTSSKEEVEPVVLHGYTATKEVPFREVCKTIGKYAFMSSDLPVIVSLEVHTNVEQQQMMVDIMRSTWGSKLLEVSDVAEDVPLPTPESLRNKILIKVKYAPPKKPNNDLAKQPSEKSEASVESASVDEHEGQELKQAAPTPSKICQALSQLGVYTRSYHFKNLEQPEAKVPTHIFSLSESKFMAVHAENATGLSEHNKSFLMRAYPKGTRVSSTNLDPAIFWRHGVQMVALNWQHWDAGTMMNEAMFAGSGGYALKPVGFRSGSAGSDAVAAAAKRYTVDLEVECLAAQDIPLPLGETKAKSFQPYIKCELHVETPEELKADIKAGGAKAKEGQYKWRLHTAKSQDPDLAREKIQFNDIKSVVPELTFVRIKVMADESYSRDNLAAWACIRLDRLQKGFRFVHLFDANGIQTAGAILVRITKRLKLE